MITEFKLPNPSTEPKRSGLSKAAQQLGRKGGKSTSGAKVMAARTNGRKGGRPPKDRK